MRVLFGSYHNIFDLGSGAAISARALLSELASQGAEATSVSGAFFDGAITTSDAFLSELRRRRILYEVKNGIMRRAGNHEGSEFQVVHYADAGIDSFAFLPQDAFGSASRRYEISSASNKAFHRTLYDKIEQFAPDLFLSYGGYRAAINGPRIARRFGATSVFYLCNHSYGRKELFSEYDAYIVPSDFTRNYYRDRLGIEATVLPPIIDEASFLTESNTREFVTMINPSREKGLFFFLGIAKELQSARPDIPLLIVESRSSAASILKISGASALGNLRIMKATPRPREIYARTRITLVPSVCHETFGRVAVESALNGIPVLTSGRGALSEVIPSEFNLPIPERFTPFIDAMPTSAEVAPWLDAIIQLWDNDALALNAGATLQESAQRYRQEQVVERSFNTCEALVKKRKK